MIWQDSLRGLSRDTYCGEGENAEEKTRVALLQPQFHRKHWTVMREPLASARCSHYAWEMHTGLSLKSLGCSSCSHCAWEMQLNILSLSNPLRKHVSRKAMTHNQKAVWKVPRVTKKHLTADMRPPLTKSLLWVAFHYAQVLLVMYLQPQETNPQLHTSDSDRPVLPTTSFQ